jgi:hypothetical protein
MVKTFGTERRNEILKQNAQEWRTSGIDAKRIGVIAARHTLQT